jgi:hypothetical protein
MGSIFTSRQRRYRFFRFLKHIFGFIFGIGCAVVGATGLIYIFKMGKAFIVHFTTPGTLVLGLVALLLVISGLLVIKDTIRSIRNRWLDDVDLDSEPWMANAEWRNRRIVHKKTAAVRYLQILGMGFVLGVIGFGAITVPVKILAIAVMVAGVIALALFSLYKHFRKEIRPLYIVPLLFFVPVIIFLPGATGLLSPELKRVMEVTGMTIMVGAAGYIFIYLLMQEEKYGISVCHLKMLPAFVGGSFDAEVEIDFPKSQIGFPELPEGPVEAQLLNISSSGRSVTVNWKTKSVIPINLLIRPGDGTLRIPLSVAIPIEEREKMKDCSFWNGGSWKLEVRAAFPGVDYASRFIVPVYFPKEGSTQI